ncbi:adenylyl-sulfate kinase [Streptomyces sp. NPDC006458]|uniref:adenylyl-sulfate kinase n=1 Tax=Streptomyces sp. NPDC006458 TaxID=3154302 RepID=UPI0033B1C48E
MQLRPRPCACGVTVWLTGASGARTAAVARELARRLRELGSRAAALDADGPLGADVLRVGLTAEVLARNGVIVLVASTADSPAGSTAHPGGRDDVRERHRRSGTHFLPVHLPAPARPTDTAAALLTGLLAEKRFVA